MSAPAQVDDRLSVGPTVADQVSEADTFKPRSIAVQFASNGSEPIEFETPLEASQAAYVRNLPELLNHHQGEWVAFADGKLVRLAKSQTELYRHCLNDLGLPHDRFVVRRIVPRGSQQIEV